MSSDERYCKVCATRIEVGDGYCPSCGSKIVWVTEEQVAANPHLGTPVTVEYLDAQRRKDDMAKAKSQIWNGLIGFFVVLMVLIWLIQR